MHPLESPLAADGTPTSGLTDGGAAASPAPKAGACGREADSCAAPDSVHALASPLASCEGGLPAEEPSEVASPAAAANAYGAGGAAHAAAEHLVWTNEDGDIDALPWDMGGWSTGSSGQREGSEERGGGGGDAAGPKPPPNPVDEDALIGALQRKVGRCSNGPGGAGASGLHGGGARWAACGAASAVPRCCSMLRFPLLQTHTHTLLAPRCAGTA